MLVLVDGYNATMRHESLSGRSREVQRDILVERLRTHHDRIAGRGGRVVAVFDAHGSLMGSTETTGNVTAVFARSADDEIVRRCAAATGPVAVYTDDMRLRMRISQDVGRHMEYRDVSALFSGGRPVRESATRVAEERDRPPRRVRDEITAELEDIWLAGEEE